VLPSWTKTSGVLAMVICAEPPVPCAYTYGRPWPMVVRSVRVPSNQ
jgi:hypothetical protein